MPGNPIPLALAEPHGLSRPWKITFALAAAAAAPASIFAVLSCLGYASDSSLAGSSGLELAGGLLYVFALAFMVALAVSALIVVLLGLPAFLIGSLVSMIRWWTCILISFLVGMLPLFLLGWDVVVPIRGGVDLAPLLLGGLGASGGLTFWLLWHFWIDRVASAIGTAHS